MAWTIAWTGVQLAIIVILAVGAWRVDDGLLEVSSLIAFLLYAFGLMGPITELTQQITALQSGIAAAARIRDVDALALEEEAPTAPAERTAGGPILALRDVHAAYDAEPVIRGVELEIPRRGHTAIVGPVRRGQDDALQPDPALPGPDGGPLELDGRPYDELQPRRGPRPPRLRRAGDAGRARARSARTSCSGGRTPTEARDRGLMRAGPARAPRPRHAAVRHVRLRRRAPADRARPRDPALPRRAAARRGHGPGRRPDRVRDPRLHPRARAPTAPC